jgi:hypothetical protein
MCILSFLLGRRSRFIFRMRFLRSSEARVILCIWAAVSFVAGWIWRLYHATGDGRLFNYSVHLSSVRQFEERRAPRWVKSGSSVGSGLLFAAGLFVGLVLKGVLLGVLLFALGGILFAIRGYLNTGDKAVAGALMFVALVAIGIEAVVYFLGP